MLISPDEARQMLQELGAEMVTYTARRLGEFGMTDISGQVLALIGPVASMDEHIDASVMAEAVAIHLVHADLVDIGVPNGIPSIEDTITDSGGSVWVIRRRERIPAAGTWRLFGEADLRLVPGRSPAAWD